nr:hypothetical protein Iba_chr05aCG3240 [Ipomoea batatas]GMC99418.1 hypothetical protein Iba_chr05eCG5500 [Ipomoea batatas]
MGKGSHLLLCSRVMMQTSYSETRGNTPTLKDVLLCAWLRKMLLL